MILGDHRALTGCQAFGEHHYGDRKALVESEEWTGPSWDSCRKAGQVCNAFKESAKRFALLSFGHHAGTVCRKIETSRRRPLLSFRHHAEVAAPPAVQPFAQPRLSSDCS